MKTFTVIALSLILAVTAFAVKTNYASFNDGTVLLDVNTQGSNLVSFQVTNNDPYGRDAIFYVYNSVTDANNNPPGSVVVWSFRQPIGTSAVIPFPTVDNNGDPINWQLGQVTYKGITTTTVVNPPWSFTMI
jgi:hypothetical protein